MSASHFVPIETHNTLMEQTRTIERARMQDRTDELIEPFALQHSVNELLRQFNLAGHTVAVRGGAIHVIFPTTKEKLVIGAGGVHDDAETYRATLYGVSDDPRQPLPSPAVAYWQADEDIDYKVIGCVAKPTLHELLEHVMRNLRALNND